MLFALPKFSPSFKRRVVTPNKYYAVDTGFSRANSPQATRNPGRRLENAVFLALRRRGERVAYAGEKDVWECDFVTESVAVQVCAELTDFSRQREVQGVLRALALPGRRRPLILTLDQRDRLSVDGTVVDVLPAWEWMSHGAS